jgi:uncharacterized protein YcbK (DUF882 family)
MPRCALAGLVCVALATAGGHANATKRCQSDHRTLWLKDLYRGDELRVRPFGPHGIPCRREWLELTRFFRDRHGHRRIVAPGLLRVLAQIQRHLGGWKLHLMSGYRAPNDPQALSSYHQVGHAADIWIDGVADRDLFEYCRELQRSGERIGCGLYPAGTHVHVDVRSRATIWVDLSGYGDGAVYVQDPRRWLAQHPEAGRRRLLKDQKENADERGH